MLNRIIRLQTVVEIVTNKTAQALKIISTQLSHTRAAVYQHCLALYYLLASDGDLCGKF
ncbi:ENR1 protein, partial [Syrrhaptes paradoxus]|nr:ENR1 protein [Syrrhaptes paradoxus]